MNLPNALTLVRMFLVPLLVVVLLTEFEGRQILGVPKELVGAAIFALASLTDWLDGYLARRRRQVTWLGQMLDPIADKLLTSAAFISLVQLDLAPAWMVALIIGREFAVTALRSLAYAKGITIPASSLGKFKMVSQVIAILLLILAGGPLPFLAPLGLRRAVGGDGAGGRVGGGLLPALPAAGQRPRDRRERRARAARGLVPTDGRSVATAARLPRPASQVTSASRRSRRP